MHNYELEQAKADLEIAKDNLYSFLKSSYTESKYTKPQETTEQMMKYLDAIVGKMIKRQSITLEFPYGASPMWYSEVLKFFSVWIEQESKVCNLLSQELNQ